MKLMKRNPEVRLAATHVPQARGAPRCPAPRLGVAAPRVCQACLRTFVLWRAHLPIEFPGKPPCICFAHDHDPTTTLAPRRGAVRNTNL